MADVSDSGHARHVLRARIPYRRFCPDTEEVTGSNPVSPTSNIPGQTAIATAGIACVIGLANQTASLTDQLDGPQIRHPWPLRHVSTHDVRKHRRTLGGG